MSMQKTIWQRFKRRMAIRRSVRNIDVDLNAIETAIDQCLSTLNGLSTVTNALKETIRQHEAQLAVLTRDNNDLRAELQIAKEITIPALTEAHTLVLKRIEADISVQVRRAATGAP